MIRKIKIIHDIIWIIMVSAVFYILYAGITNTFNWILWVSIALLSIETLVLLFNKFKCPITSLAEKYTKERNSNFDIHLPNIVAKYNKLLFGTLFAIGMALVIFRIWTKLK